jgi:hypothetical protein
MCEDVSDRALYNVEKGRDGEKYRRNEEVSERRGELSNSRLFLRD